ncbi:hypothetical protein FOCC_FOCC014908 [Frankliniella occidentalis]|nr:hypothetical protein FOCC_FOCC014908 [Frankliniella occidentalis]
MNRTTFVETDSALRTDQMFRDRVHPNHHRGYSPLEDIIGLNMVSAFKLDPQHLIYLGLVKKILRKKLGARNIGRLADDDVALFKNLSQELGPHFPKEFNRKPRTFKSVSQLTAADFRRFLLYEGIVVMKAVLPVDEYQNFLLLHCSTYILESPEFVLQPAMVNAAEEFSKLFIQFSMQLYGQQFLIYNVHSFCHMAQECRDTQKPLYRFSCFPFENYLKIIKEALRHGYHPLQQLARRDSERNGQLEEPKEIPVGVQLKQPHFDPNEVLIGDQYKELQYRYQSLTIKSPNNCFKVSDGSIAILENIVVPAPNVVILRGKKFQTFVDFYDYPLDSTILGIGCVSDLSENSHEWCLTTFTHKCVLMPYQAGSFVCIPLLH